MIEIETNVMGSRRETERHREKERQRERDRERERGGGYCQHLFPLREREKLRGETEPVLRFKPQQTSDSPKYQKTICRSTRLNPA